MLLCDILPAVSTQNDLYLHLQKCLMYPALRCMEDTSWGVDRPFPVMSRPKLYVMETVRRNASDSRTSDETIKLGGLFPASNSFRDIFKCLA